MTGIIEDIIETLKKTNRQCSYIKATQHLPQKDQQDLQNALTQDFSTSVIHRVLKKRDIPVTYTAIGRHRRGECICEH